MDPDTNGVDADDLLLEGHLEHWDDEVAHEETIGDEADCVVDYVDEGGDGVHHDDNQYLGMEPHADQGDVEPDDELSLEAGMNMLPSRNGRTEFTMDLPDLLSRAIALPDQAGISMYLCFSKKCVRQLAFDGHIYNIAGTLCFQNYNIWRCTTEHCHGAVRTSPNFESIKLRGEHIDNCIGDDVQVRLRISVYDLRLMSEFTDIRLDLLYASYVDQIRTEHGDIAHLFPTFDMLKASLEHHRTYKLYRKRFEVRKYVMQRRQNRDDLDNGHLGPMLGGSAVHFRRTKPFPPSMCVECNQEMVSSDLAPSHDLLIEHLTYTHERPLLIERYEFPSIALFEQWIRELQQHSRYRLKKVGMFDEHMYYLCQNDDRQHRCNHGKGGIIRMQCTAFVRVHDWRILARNELKVVVVDYCLDHTFHSGSTPLPENVQQPVYDYYSPEIFVKELENRRLNTQRLIADSNLQRIKRLPAQAPLLSPVPAQQSVVPVTYKTRAGYQSSLPDHDDEQLDIDPDGESIWDEVDGEYIRTASADDLASPPAPRARAGAVPIIRKPFSHLPSTSTRVNLDGMERVTASITQRHNFDDRNTFEAVQQLEMQVNVLKMRMQQCRRADVARKYLTRITSVLDDVMADPNCAPRMHGISNKFVAEEGDDSPKPGMRVTTKRRTSSRVSHVKTDAGDVCDSGAPQKEDSDGEGTVRQAMFLKRGGNGEMVVVKRILRKVRKVVEVAEEPVSVTSYSANLPESSGELEENVLEDEDPTSSHQGSSTVLYQPGTVGLGVVSGGTSQAMETQQKPDFAHEEIKVLPSVSEEIAVHKSPHQTRTRGKRVSNPSTPASEKPDPVVVPSDDSVTPSKRGRGRPRKPTVPFDL